MLKSSLLHVILAAFVCALPMAAQANPEFDTTGATFDGYQCGCHHHGGMAYSGATENEAAAAASVKCGATYTCVKKWVAHPYSSKNGSRLPSASTTSTTSTVH